MYCTRCGSVIPDHSKFCNECGAPTVRKSLPSSKENTKTDLFDLDICSIKHTIEEVQRNGPSTAPVSKNRQNTSDEQLAEVERLEGEIAAGRKAILISLLLAFGFWGLAILLALNGLQFWFYIFMFAGIGMIYFLDLFAKQHRQNVKDIKIVKNHYKDYLRELDNRRRNAQIEKEKLRKQWELDHPICPMCSSRDTYKISTTNRVVSVAMVGLASSKIGKQYGCRKCNHKW